MEKNSFKDLANEIPAEKSDETAWITPRSRNRRNRNAASIRPPKYIKRPERGANIKPRQKIQKKSFGVACVRKIDSKRQILMVRRRYSYEFSNFALGRYPDGSFWDNRIYSKINSMMSKMTLEDKIAILTLNFDDIWRRIWIQMDKSPIYYHSCAKFNSMFMIDGGERLKKMILNSKSADNLWELPKGHRKYKSENECICAMREFTEETNIKLENFKLYPNYSRTYSYNVGNRNYICKYFLAIPYINIKPELLASNYEQISEISGIKWFDIEDVKKLPNSAKLMPYIKSFMSMHKKII